MALRMRTFLKAILYREPGSAGERLSGKEEMMRLRSILIGCLVLSWLLAACGSGEMVPPPDPTRVPDPDSSVETPAASGNTTEMPVARPYDPQPADSALQRGNVYLDATEIVLMESFPPQVGLHLVGNLPTPCHQLRVAVSQPDEEKNIGLDVYSVVDGSRVCAEVLQPFEVNLNLGSYPAGEYTLLVNGNSIGKVLLP